MKRIARRSIAFVLISGSAYAQHHQKPADDRPVLQFKGVLTQVLSDPELKDFKMESSVMTIRPGGVDTISHRHDCELFGYVLEGSVDVALVTKNANTFHTGEMFYEKRNILHTLTRNNSHDKVARVLLIFIMKEGRAGYTLAYPNK